MSNVFWAIPIIALALAVIIQSFKIERLQHRITQLERKDKEQC